MILQSQNVFFTLWIALLVLAVMKYVSEKRGMVGSVAAFGTDCRSSRWNGSGTSVTITDHGAFGVLAIAELYFLRKKTESDKYFAAVCCSCGRLRHHWHFYRSTTIMASGA